MNVDTLIIVLTHVSTQVAFLRHLWLWERHECQILVISSGGSITTEHPQIITPHIGHSGQPCYLRVRELFHYLTKWTSFKQYVIFECDSFCTSKTIPDFEYGVNCILLPNKQPSPFISDSYPMLPYGMTRKTVVDIDCGYRNHVLGNERWYGDRAIGELSRLQNISMVAHNDIYFCREKIEPKDYPEIERGIKERGMCWFHGIKDVESYDFIVNCARTNNML